LTTNNNHIDDLIARYLAGEASESEKLRLEQWMNASEENKKYFGDIRFVHDKAVASHKIVRVNVDKAWDSVRTQMQQKTPPKARRKTSYSIAFWARMAAIFIVVFGLSFWFYKNYQSKMIQPQSIASENNTLTYKLTDSSQVFLNRHSKITFTSGYGKKQRNVSLSGEAYFKVIHSTEKPFIVEAEGTLIKDIGTSFNIKAYAGDSLVEVFVESGQVAFFTRENPGILIYKGEKGTFEKATKTFRLFKAIEPNILAYKNKVLIFQNAMLSEVLDKLNAIYQTKITLSNDQLMNCKITVTFDDENIDAIMGVISETLRLRLTKTTDGFRLEGDICNNL